MLLQGGLLALLAAVLFGISTPLVQIWGRGVGAFGTAALLYAGAAAVAAFMRRPQEREAPLRASDLPRLLAMATCGAVIGPVALAWGLQRTDGTSAALMLTLEAVFTAALAARLYGEALDRRVLAAMSCLVTGGVLLVLDQGHQGTVQMVGLAAVLLATLAWGIDNTLSRGVANRDPGQVVLVKSSLGLLGTWAMATFSGESLPPLGAALALVAIGASGYGLSLHLYLLAQRSFGAARTGSVFAFAPFIGASLAFAMGERVLTPWMLGGAGLMLTGVVLHLSESHDHTHTHQALEHEHAHRHDDGHHNHTHATDPSEPHSHRHVHEAMTHRHPHGPDAHHNHVHG